MSEKRKLPPDELWDAVEDMAMADEAQRVRKMNAKELDQQLAAKGIDPQKLRERAAAMAARAAQATRQRTDPARNEPGLKVSSNVVKGRFSRRGRWAALLVAASLPVAVGLLYLIPAARPGNTHQPDPNATQRAAALRQEAFTACNVQHWKECSERLDRAAEIDPNSEQLPEVKERRRQIAQATQGER
jgi:hypothetical protein